MFGRIRASPSSLESLEGSPSKILKDDTFSIYEATLMKLKLGAQREFAHSDETDQVMDDCSASLPCSEEANLKADLSPSGSQHLLISPGQLITMMNTDCSSPSVSSNAVLEQRRESNVSILRFFKFKDPGQPLTSTRNASFESVSSSSTESHCTAEVESIQTLQDCEMPD